MATSGTIQQAIRTGYRIQIAWTVDSQSVANNTSTVTAKVQLVSTGASYTINSTASKSGSLTINGTAYTFTFSAALSGNQTKTIFTKTVTVSHNADGSKTCAFSTTCGINVTLNGTYFGNVTASGSGTFNTIARASTISSITSSAAITGSNAITVNIARASSSFTHTVTYTFGSYSNTLTGIATSASYVIPLTWLNAIPNAVSGIGSVTVTTYSGSTKIGSAVSASFTLTAPATIVPIIGTVGISEAVSGIAVQFHGYVQSKSRLAVSVASGGVYSSTIASIKTVIEGVTYQGASFTSGILTGSGSVSVSITVTDSRGRTASTTRTITVIPYEAPKIISFQGFRSLQDGTENYEGSYLTTAVNFSVAPVNNRNSVLYTIEYKLQASQNWIMLKWIQNVYSMNQYVISDSAILSPDDAYEIRLTVNDFFTSVSSIFTVPTAFTLVDFNRSGKGIAIGKVSAKDAFEIAIPVDLQAELIQEARKDAALMNGWYNFGGTYAHAAFWKDKLGIVHLEGMIGGGTKTPQTVLLNLPIGYRPRTREIFPAVSADAYTTLEIVPNGDVLIRNQAGSWISLSGVSFRYT